MNPDLPRWFGVGHSDAPDARAAGAAAVAEAAAGREAALLLVFCSADADHAALLDAVRAGAGPRAAIAGCTTNGQVVGLEPYRGHAGVTVLALGGEGLTVTTAVARDVPGRRREAGAELGERLAAVRAPHRAALLLADGLIGEQHEVVRGAYSVVGATIPLVGGCAADEFGYRRTFQFAGDSRGVEILSGAVVAVGLGSEGPLGVGLAHGWRKQGEPMIVTRSSGGTVHEFDDERAADRYLHRIGVENPALADPADFSRTAYAHPLGLSRRSGEDLRVIHSGDLAEGTLLCLADVPQGALAWTMETDRDSLLRAGEQSVEQAVAALGGAAPVGLIQFNCGARRAMLGDEQLGAETARMRSVLGDVPFGGFYTFGEIARTHGARGLHHLTVVSLAIG